MLKYKTRMELSIRPAQATNATLLAEMNKRFIKDERCRKLLSVDALHERIQQRLMANWNIDVLMVDSLVTWYTDPF